MAYRQDEPVPEHVKLTLRVDSAAYPALAALLWEMPWGARNNALIDLLVLGMQAKAAGMVSAVTSPPDLSRRSTRFPTQSTFERPEQSGVLSGGTQPVLHADIFPAPPLDAVRSAARVHVEEPDEEPSAVSLLLGQFVG